MRTSIEVAKIALTMLALFIVAVLLYPVILIIAQAIVGNTAVIVSSFDYLARYGITLDNFKAIIRDPLFLESLRNTLIVGILTVVFAIVFIIPSAYAFSRFSFRGRDTILYIYLIVSQAGGGLGLIAVLALYMFLLRLAAYGLNLFNVAVLALIYVSGMVPFQTWLMKSYFDQIPRTLDEAAFIDGADWATIIFRVVLPASRAAFIIIALFAFMGAWGEFVTANLLRIQTLGKYIYETIAGGQAAQMQPAVAAAGALLYALPMIVLFTISQKYIGEAYRLGMGKA